MNRITFVLWKWGTFHYQAKHVNDVVQGIRARYLGDHRTICITDRPEGVQCETFPLWNDHSNIPNPSGPQMPSCYRRLKLFDQGTQAALGINPGERICWVDLDVLFTNEITHLYPRPEPMVACVVNGFSHKQIINGSMIMFTAGSDWQWLWDGFDPVESPRASLRARYLGSDQGYLSHKLAGKIGGEVGGWFPREHGVLSYWRDLRKTGLLPVNAKIIFFAGVEKHWQPHVQKRSPWIKRYLEPLAA